MWSACSRLIATAAFFYNTALPFRIHEQKLMVGAVPPSKSAWPVAWQHVNPIGSFEFSEIGAMVDLDVMAALHEWVEYWRQATVKEAPGSGSG